MEVNLLKVYLASSINKQYFKEKFSLFRNNTFKMSQTAQKRGRPKKQALKSSKSSKDMRKYFCENCVVFSSCCLSYVFEVFIEPTNTSKVSIRDSGFNLYQRKSSTYSFNELPQRLQEWNYSHLLKQQNLHLLLYQLPGIGPDIVVRQLIELIDFSVREYRNGSPLKKIIQCLCDEYVDVKFPHLRFHPEAISFLQSKKITKRELERTRERVLDLWQNYNKHFEGRVVQLVSHILVQGCPLIIDPDRTSKAKRCSERGSQQKYPKGSKKATKHPCYLQDQFPIMIVYERITYHLYKKYNLASSQQGQSHSTYLLGVVRESGRWFTLGLDEVCEWISEWRSSQIHIDFNKTKNILKKVMNVAFPNLKLLNLNYNSIQSVQIIVRIHLPVLSQLSIGGNKIHNINIIRKAYWPEITELDIAQNHIKETNLSGMYCASLQCFYVEYVPAHPQQCLDIAWVSKLQTGILRYLFICSSKRNWRKQYLSRMKHQIEEGGFG